MSTTIDGPNNSDLEERKQILESGYKLWEKFRKEMTGLRKAYKEVMRDDDISLELWVSFSDMLKKHIGDENAKNGVTNTMRAALEVQENITEWEERFRERANRRAEGAEKNVEMLTAANEALTMKVRELEDSNKKLQQRVGPVVNQEIVVSGSNSQSTTTHISKDCEQRCQKLQIQLNLANRESVRYQAETAAFMQLADDTIKRLGGSSPPRQHIDFRAAIYTPNSSRYQDETSPNTSLTDENIGGMLNHWEGGQININKLLARNRKLEGELLRRQHAGQEITGRSQSLDLDYLVSNDEIEGVSYLPAGNVSGLDTDIKSGNLLYQQYVLGIEYLNKVLPYATDRAKNPKKDDSEDVRKYWDHVVLYMEYVLETLSRNKTESYDSFAEYATKEHLTLRDAQREVKDLKKQLAHCEQHKSISASQLQSGSEEEVNKAFNQLALQGIERRIADLTGLENRNERQEEDILTWQSIWYDLQNHTIFGVLERHSEDLRDERVGFNHLSNENDALKQKLKDAEIPHYTSIITDGTDDRQIEAVSLDGIRRKIQELKAAGTEHEWYTWVESQLESGNNLMTLLQNATTELHQNKERIESHNKRVQELEALVDARLENHTADEKTKASIAEFQKRLSEATKLLEMQQRSHDSAIASVKRQSEEMQNAERQRKQEVRDLKDQIAQLRNSTVSPSRANTKLVRDLRAQIKRLENQAEHIRETHGESAQVSSLEQDLLDLEQRSKNAITKLEAENAALRRKTELSVMKIPDGHQTSYELMQSSTLAYLQLQIDADEKSRNKAESLLENERVKGFTDQLDFLRDALSILSDDEGPNDLIHFSYQQNSIAVRQIRDLRAQLEKCEKHKASIVAGDNKAIFNAQVLAYFHAELKKTEKVYGRFKKKHPEGTNEDLERRMTVCRRGVGGFSLETADLADSFAIQYQRREALVKENDVLEVEIQELSDQLEGLIENPKVWGEGGTIHETATAEVVDLKDKIASQDRLIEQCREATYAINDKLRECEERYKGQTGNVQSGPAVELPLQSFVQELQERIRTLEDRIVALRVENNKEEKNQSRANNEELHIGGNTEEVDAQPEGLADENEKLYKKISSQTDELITLEDSVRELEENNRTLEARIQNYKDLPEDTEEAAFDLLQRIEVLQAEVEDLQEIVDDANDCYTQLKEQDDRIAELHTMLNRYENPELGTLEEQLAKVNLELLQSRNESVPRNGNDEETEALRAEMSELREKVEFYESSHRDEGEQQSTPPQSQAQSLRTHLRKIAKLEALLKDQDVALAALHEPATSRGRENILKNMTKKQEEEIQDLKKAIKKNDKEIQALKQSIAEYEETTNNFEALLSIEDNGAAREEARLKLVQDVKRLKAKRGGRTPSRSLSPSAERDDEKGGRRSNVVSRSDLPTIEVDDTPIFGGDEEGGPAGREETDEEEDPEYVIFVESLLTRISQMDRQIIVLEERFQQQAAEIQALGYEGDEGLLAQIDVLQAHIEDLEEKLDKCSKETWLARKKRVQAADAVELAARPKPPPFRRHLDPCLDQQRNWEETKWGGGRFTIPKPKTRMASRPSKGPSKRASPAVGEDKSSSNSSDEEEIDMTGITRVDDNPDTPPSIKKRENTPSTGTTSTSRKRGKGRKGRPSPEPQSPSSSDSESGTVPATPSSDDDNDRRKTHNKTPSRPRAKKVQGQGGNAAGSSSAVKNKKIAMSAHLGYQKRTRTPQSEEKDEGEDEGEENEISPPMKKSKKTPGPRKK